jgi:hemolysin activation/secretion protein
MASSAPLILRLVLPAPLVMALLAAPPQLLAAEPSADTASAHFALLEIRVLGNTLLPAVDIEGAVYPHLGANKAFADVEAARADLEARYRAKGFQTVFVDVPEQEVGADGIVRLLVSEGVLSRVRVEGARYFSANKIRAAIPAAQLGAAPQFVDLQSQLTQLNARTRDLAVVPVLAAGAIPGSVDLKLKVDDTLPLHGSVEVNDQYTADTSRLRVLGSLSYDNLFNRLDSISLQYQIAPEEPGELGVFAANYVTHVGSTDTRLALFFVDSDSDVAATGTLSVLGKGKVFGTRLIHPIVNVSGLSHTVTLGLDYKDFKETILLDSDELATPISYLNASLGYSGAWRKSWAEWTFDSTANLGFRGVANSADEFANKRFRARANPFHIRSNASISVPLRAFTLSARLQGQYAIDPLVGNEQLSIGGAESVRGYLEAEETGDIGIAGSLELVAPQLLKLESSRFQLSPLLFADAGRVSLQSVLPDEARSEGIGSLGIGTRFSAYGFLSGSLFWAYPLFDGTRTKSGDSRIHFNVRADW